MHWNDPSDWIWSPETTHEALIDPDLFGQVQRQQSTGNHRPAVAVRQGKRGPYVLSSLMSGGICGRRMQGTWNNQSPHYRCRFPSEYALTKELDHPKTVYVRENTITPALDEWLAAVFDPGHIEATCEARAAASETDGAAEASVDAARRKLADCDARLAQYRSALDAGADPKVVAGSMAQVQAQRLGAERLINDAAPSRTLSTAEIRARIGSVQDMVTKLTDADPQTKADLYRHLGIKLTYHPKGRVDCRSQARRPMYYGACRRTDPRTDYTRAGQGQLRGLTSLTPCTDIGATDQPVGVVIRPIELLSEFVNQTCRRLQQRGAVERSVWGLPRRSVASYRSKCHPGACDRGEEAVGAAVWRGRVARRLGAAGGIR